MEDKRRLGEIEKVLRLAEELHPVNTALFILTSSVDP